MTVYVLSKFHGGDGEEWLAVYATEVEARAQMETVAAASRPSDLIVVSAVGLGELRSELWTENRIAELRGGIAKSDD